MSDFFDVRKNKSSENFNNKSRLLGLSIEKQVEHLNNTYKDKMLFHVVKDIYTGENIIELYWVNPEIRILELPEVDNLSIGYIKGIYFDENEYLSVKYAKLGTIKLPKTIKKFKIRDLCHMPNLSSIWLWDTTELDLEKPSYSNVNMVIVQKVNGGKPIVYRI